MADQHKIAVIEPEVEPQAGGCCEPECGPTTCEPAEAVVAAPDIRIEVKEPEPRAAKSGSCGCA